jgi:CheY-like chemotaxis protein
MSLERIGKMTVEIVGDPTAAIDAMTAFGPDLVLLDWMMPGMDGPTVFRAMKERPETRALPVVFITAKASQAELAEVVALGAVGAISKPFSPKDLPDQLRAIWAKLP